MLQKILGCLLIFSVLQAQATLVTESKGSYDNAIEGFYGSAQHRDQGHFDRLKISTPQSLFHNVFRSGQPNYSNPNALDTLQQNGIKLVLNLRKESTAETINSERALLESLGIELMSLPLDTSENPDPLVNSPKLTRQTLQTLTEYLRSHPNNGVLIHCMHGEDRTGVLIRLLRELNGELPADTIKEFNAYGGSFYPALKKLYLAVLRLF